MGVGGRAVVLEQVFERNQARQRGPGGKGEDDRDQSDRGEGRERA